MDPDECPGTNPARELQYHAFLLKAWRSKIQKQSPFESTGLQVIQQLCFIDAGQRLDRLEFDHDFSEADKVCAIANIQFFPLKRMDIAFSLSNGIWRTENSLASASWYTASKNPCPRTWCTSIAAPMIA